MTEPERDQPSLLVSLALLAAVSVMLVVPAHGVYSFFTQKKEIVAEQQEQVESSLVSLSANVVPLLQAYAVSDYQGLVQTEMGLRNYVAILIEDFNMAQVLGRPEYVTGMIRTPDGEVMAYRGANPVQRQRLTAADVTRHTWPLQSEGVTVGRLSIYTTDALVRQKQKEIFLDSLGDSLLMSVVLMALLILFSKYRIIDPLAHFVEALQERDADGIPVRVLPSFKYRELTLLTDTVNAMLDMIRSSRAAIERERTRLRNVIDGTHVGTWEWNIQTGTTEFNERWAEIIGYGLGELGPTTIETWWQLLHPDDRAKAEQQLQRHFAGKTPFCRYEVRMKHKAGHWVWVLNRGKVISRTAKGQPLMMYGTCQDISEQKENELRLRLAASVYECISDGIMVIDPDGVIRDVNAAFCQLTGYQAGEVLGESIRVLRSDQQGEPSYHTVWQALLTQGNWSGELCCKRKNGELFPAYLKVDAIPGADGQVGNFVVLLSDISHFKAHEQQLEQLAHFDALTGLPNRLVLAERLRNAMAQARRRGELLAVAFLDFDGFKSVNDRFGHDAGDQLLITMAQRMEQTLRESDTLVRIGGDEFVVLLPDLTEPEGCLPVIRRLLAVASSPVMIEADRVQVSASIGVTFYPQAGEVSAEQLLHQADQMMYAAKWSGKNRYQLADPAPGPQHAAG